MTDNLWCIEVPGPGDVYAAPDRDAAQRMADEHNAAVRRFIDRNPLTDDDPPLDSIMAVVIPWPWDAQAHADSLSRETTP